MQIINGRWVDDKNNPIDERTSPKFIELGRKIQSLYGKSITYNRIKMVKEINSLSEQEESVLCSVLDKNLINKLL